jgi:hypothetical protein
MPDLILPPHLKHLYRPLKAASTEDLILELHQRDLMHELTGTIAMPDPSSLPPDLLTAEYWASLRQTQVLELAKQMGQAIVIKQHVLLMSAMQAAPTTKTGEQEIIIAKALICRHPELVGLKVTLDIPERAPNSQDGQVS